MPAPFSFSSRFLFLAAALGLLFVMPACFSSGHSTGGGLEATHGAASYYGDKFAGRTTANGETFDPSDMTAAHRSLPFDTRVRVTRTDAPSRSVTVRINDRGPYVDGRIIDLSRAAARKIGMINEGVVEVQVEVLDTPTGGGKTSSRQSEKDNTGSSGGW